MLKTVNVDDKRRHHENITNIFILIIIIKMSLQARLAYKVELNPYCQISGKWARPYYWKTHPIVNWRILGRDTGRITGKIIQTKCYISYMVSIKKFEWMSFPVVGSGSRPDFWKKLNRYSWFFIAWVFQVNGLAHQKFWMSFPWFDDKG